jgi:hypothetical protein
MAAGISYRLSAFTISFSRIFIAPQATATTDQELSGIKIAVTNGESCPVTANAKPIAL